MTDISPRVRRKQKSNRRGATAVEFALVCFPLFFLVFATFEFGRGMMAVASAEEAARDGCRIAILDGTTNQDVEDTIDDLLSLAGINQHTVDFDPPIPANANQADSITVSVSMNFDDVAWLSLPGFLTGRSYTARCVLPKEGGD